MANESKTVGKGSGIPKACRIGHTGRKDSKGINACGEPRLRHEK